MAGCNGSVSDLALMMAVAGLVWVDRGAVRVCKNERAGRAGRVKIWSTKRRRTAKSGESRVQAEQKRATTMAVSVSRRRNRQAGKDRERTSTNNNTLTSRKQRRERERERARLCKVQECERRSRDMRMVVQGSGRVFVSSSSQACASFPRCNYALNSSGNDAIDSTPPRSPNKWSPNKGPRTWSSTITLSSVGICICDLVVVVR